jgi:hypothetical protein
LALVLSALKAVLTGLLVKTVRLEAERPGTEIGENRDVKELAVSAFRAWAWARISAANSLILTGKSLSELP